MDRHMRRRGNTQPNTVASISQDDDFDAVANDNGLIQFPRDNQHRYTRLIENSRGYFWVSRMN